MTDPRHTTRVLAFQCLCLLDAQGDEALPLLGRFLDEHAPDGETVVRADGLARAVWAEHRALDEELAVAARNWAVTRMQAVDRSILRLGAFEILRDENVPAAVAINEAVEIAKDFGGAESPGFINGILDGLKQTANAAGDSGADSATDAAESNESSDRE